MYNLKAELRAKDSKAKHLRRDGIVPATIYGRNLKESILIQVPLTDINRFLSSVSRGGTLTVEVGAEKHNVLFKEITREPIKQQIQQIEFQHIVADEPVNSIMKIVLVNREKNPNLMQQHLEEIPYNALPKHFVQEVVIDLAGMQSGTVVKIEDLDVAKNENIKIAIPHDSPIVSLTELKRSAPQEEEQE